MKYAKWLREMRLRAGFTQKEVSKIIGVSRKAVSRWELGETRPDYEVAQGLFKLYECSEREILDFINPSE